MKKKLALLLSAVICISGCSNTHAEVTTTLTAEITSAAAAVTEETAVPAAEETSITAASQDDAPKENWETVSEYDFEKDIKPVFEKHGIFYNSMKYLGAVKIDEWRILFTDDDEKVSMFDYPTKIILMTNDEKVEITGVDYMGNPRYFIWDNKLCIYDDYLKNGFYHLGYYEYNLSDSKKICEYTETYQLNGKPEDVTRKNCSFSSFDDVYKIIENCGNRLYSMQSDLPETYLFGYPPDVTIPTDEEQLEILENIFYGKWENKERNEERNLTYQACYFSFGSGCYPQCVTEIDEGYVLQYIAGGVFECFFIKRINTSVMYSTYYDFHTGGITIDKNTVKYHKKSQQYNTEISAGKISSLGQIKLNNILGEDFKECLYNALEQKPDYTDKNGIVWCYDAGGYGLPPEERYLVSCTENKVELALRHFKKSEYYAFIEGDWSIEPEERYFVFTFEKTNNGWQHVGTGEYLIEVDFSNSGETFYISPLTMETDEVVFFEAEYDKTYNTEDNPEMFDENGNFTGEETTCKSVYKKAAVGDKFGSLTLTRAETHLNFLNDKENSDIKIGVPFYSKAEFEGEITLKGILEDVGDEHPVWYGYLFIPFSDSLKENNLPLLHYYTDGWAYGENRFIGRTTHFAFSSYSEDSKTVIAQIDELLGDNNYAKVEITLSDIYMQWPYENGSGYDPYSANLVSVRPLEE